MKSLYSVSIKNLFTGQITNIKPLKIYYGLNATCIETKIFAFSISVSYTHSIRIAVFFPKVISTTIKVYGMKVFSFSNYNSRIALIDCNYIVIINFHKSVHIFLRIYRQFRLCITKASGKAHTPNVERIQRLSLRESSRDSG